MTEPIPAAAPESRVLLTRVFDAPRAEVFAAWTQAARVAAWFCPDGFDVRSESVLIELRVEGRYELTMVHRESGREHALRYRIAALAEPELLVLEAEPMPEMGLPAPTVTRIELVEEDGRTRMTLDEGPYPPGGGPRARGGWTQAFDKLQRTLA